MEKICVAVRFRPPVPQENPSTTNPNQITTTNPPFWKIDDNRISFYSPHGTPVSGLSFAFDHVFDQECSNASVYERHTKDVIQAAVNGFNGTVFAYGQTSSGKTYTMKGSADNPGVILLAVKDIFDYIGQMCDREFLIRVSYMEIYNEEINDLFRPENRKLQIHENLERGIFVAGLREEIVSSYEHVIRLIECGEVHRHVGQTNINLRSSRSHTIFRMVIESRGKDASDAGDGSGADTDTVRVSVLNLVDLAGSERIAKTGAGGVRLKEGKYINKSLMVLGNVINKLSENGGRQRGHIPYRDSKLTRILQPALGGNAKTSIICTAAPEEVHMDETRGTLQFASRAKRITNCAQVNEILTDAALLKRQKQEIEELHRKLQGSVSEVLEQEILKLRNDMLKSEQEREKLALELEKERNFHKEREQYANEEPLKEISNNLTLLDHNRGSGKGSCSSKMGGDTFKTECDSLFRTPCPKDFSKVCISKRARQLVVPDCTPLPDDFVNIADEDLWSRMNKGHSAADLDMLQMTPDNQCSTVPLRDDDSNYCTIGKYEEEAESLREQLESAVTIKSELEKKLEDQLSLNQHLMKEVSELQHEAVLIKRFPQTMCKDVLELKDTYSNAFSNIQIALNDEKPVAPSLLGTMCEIVNSLFDTIDSRLLGLMDGHIDSEVNLSRKEQCEMLAKKLSSAAASVKSETSDASNSKFSPSSNNVKENEEGSDESAAQLLTDAREQCINLERECSQLKEEKAFLLQRLSMTTESLALINDQKEDMKKQLRELRSLRCLQDQLKLFGYELNKQHNLLSSINNEFKYNFRGVLE